MKKTAVTHMPIDSLIAERWSPRALDANKPVSHEQIISLLEAARWAPSCFGDQPWRFIVWDRHNDIDAWNDALNCLAPSNEAWAKNAPVLILVCSDTLFNHNQQLNRWGHYDTGAAAENLCLQATSLGLFAHQMGGFDATKARAEFEIPEQYDLMSMIAVGYLGDAEQLSEELKKRELSPRQRRPLGELFFNGLWNRPIL